MVSLVISFLVPADSTSQTSGVSVSRPLTYRQGWLVGKWILLPNLSYPSVGCFFVFFLRCSMASGPYSCPIFQPAPITHANRNHSKRLRKNLSISIIALLVEVGVCSRRQLPVAPAQSPGSSSPLPANPVLYAPAVVGLGWGWGFGSATVMVLPALSTGLPVLAVASQSTLVPYLFTAFFATCFLAMLKAVCSL